MAVKKKQKGRFQEIRIPTDANRDAGIFLIFLGVVASWPLTFLIERLVFHDQEVDYYISAAVCVVLVLVGSYLMYGSRKVFRVDSEENRIIIKDGLLQPALRFGWREAPAIRLQSVEEDRGGQAVELWLVNLVDGKIQYTVDRRPEQLMESRTLAEMLAKAVGCPVVENLDDAGAVILEKDDLDLPFRERVRKYPVLLGKRYEEPEGCDVECQSTEEEEVFRWGLKSTGTLLEMLSVLAFLVGLAFVPWPVGDKRISMVDLALHEGQYLYFLALGGLFLVALLVVLGYRSEIRATGERLCSRDSLWGIPIVSRCIPADELEEISVRLTSRGAYVQFVSDELIITERLSCQGSSHWVAYRLRRFYAPDDLEEAPLTVEMPIPQRLKSTEV